MTAVIGPAPSPPSVLTARDQPSVNRTAKKDVSSRVELISLGFAFLLFYEYLGWWLRNDVGFAIGDAIARSADAVYVTVSRDPHLAAIGFYWPPLSSFIQIPFVALLHLVGRSDMAGPVTSAICMTGTVIVINLACRDLGLRRPLRLAVCVMFGLNPVVAFYAANGMSEASAFMCLSVGMWGFIRWVRDRRSPDLALMATGLAFAAMARVECIVVAVVVALIAGFEWRGLPRSLPRSIARASLGALPPAYLFALWLLVQWVLLRDPLFFVHTAGKLALQQNLANNPLAASYMLPQAKDKLKVAGWLMEQYTFFGPTLFLGAAYAVVRPRRARVPLGLLAGASVFVAIQIPYRLHGTAFNDPRYFTPLTVMGTLTAAWLLAEVWPRPQPLDGLSGAGPSHTPPAGGLYGHRGLRVGATVLVLGSLLAGAVIGTFAEANPRRARVVQEDAFFARVLGRPRPYLYRSEWIAWQHVAKETDALLARPGLHRVICNASTCNAAVVYSRHPNKFVVVSDRDFQSIVSDPTGRFDLAITEGSADPIAALLTPTSDWKSVGQVKLSGLSDSATATIWEEVGSTSAGTPGSAARG